MADNEAHAAYVRAQEEEKEKFFAISRDRTNFRERCKKNDSGDWLCRNCEAVLTKDDVVLCEKCTAIAREKQEQRRRHEEAQRLDRAFENYCNGNGSNVRCRAPSWEWARFSNQEFRSRVSPKLLAGVEGSGLDESKVLSAPTGRGKSSIVWAELNRKLEAEKAKALAGEKARLRPFAWLTGPELAGARRRSKIGEESPVVELATSTGILILDELGFEPVSDEVFFVLDHRYRAALPTIVTTGLTVNAFRDRYGDAALRRLIQPGTILEAWK